jgi:hypothetical protein
MTYTRVQKYTNLVVGKFGIQIFEVMIVVLLLLMLSFDLFVSTSAHSTLIIFGQVVVQIYLNASCDNYKMVSKSKLSPKPSFL